MRPLFLFLVCAVLWVNVAKAAPGDTTWVQANIANLSWYNNYDTTIVFPNGSTTYRKILMIFTLGKYNCGSGATYCGDWDYTVQNFLIKPGRDTMELGRFITPYANAGAPRTPWTWKQHYVYDVTDYASKLRDTAIIRILYSGYSGGFTGNIRFAFIEGTPDRPVLNVHRLWAGSYNYGDTTHSDSFNINTHFTTRTETAPAGTQATNLKFTVTGHGSDGNYCSEFCSKYYQVYVNGSSVITKNIWRSDCGLNDLYPQSGTWLYDRGNWCPGAMVYAHNNMLPGITGGTSFTTKVMFESYVRTGSGSPSYTTEANIIYYGAMNKTLDASLDNIISPNNDENSFRANPTCGLPQIRVKNTGATTITSLSIQYGVKDSVMHTYTWSGSLPSLADTVIALPVIPELSQIAGSATLYQFNASIQQVNGSIDADTTNNKLSSYFNAVPLWPATLRFIFRTNNQEISPGSGVSETSWKIYDMADNIIAQRSGNALSTIYTDTINLASQCYKLVLTDAGCDGLQWWAYSGSSVTAGYFYAKKLPNTNLNMNGYNYAGTYNNDFGCSFTQYFYVAPFPAGIEDVVKDAPVMTSFPNPAKEQITIDITGLSNGQGVIEVYDVLGKKVDNIISTSFPLTIPTAKLHNGIHTIVFIPQGHSELRLKSSIMVLK